MSLKRCKNYTTSIEWTAKLYILPDNRTRKCLGLGKALYAFKTLLTIIAFHDVYAELTCAGTMSIQVKAMNTAETGLKKDYCICP